MVNWVQDRKNNPPHNQYRNSFFTPLKNPCCNRRTGKLLNKKQLADIPEYKYRECITK